MSPRKNLEYLFKGSFNYIDKPKELSTTEIEGNLTPDTKGFFKGSLSREGRQYDIVGHLKKNHGLSHILFVVTPYKSLNRHHIYSASSADTNDFEGNYTGKWYLTLAELHPNIVNDYHSLIELVSKGSIDGCVELELKKLTNIDKKPSPL
jgi:hypothetical protein